MIYNGFKFLCVSNKCFPQWGKRICKDLLLCYTPLLTSYVNVITFYFKITLK